MSNESSSTTGTDTPQQPNATARKSFDDVAKEQGWGDFATREYNKRLIALEEMGANALKASPAGELTPEQITAMAKQVLADKDAKNIKDTMRNSLTGGVLKASSKASLSTVGGVIKGAAVGGLIGVVTRPINWVLNKVSGGRLKVSMGSLITLGAVFYGGKNMFQSVGQSYGSHTGHNSAIADLSQSAVETGIRKAYDERMAQSPGVKPKVEAQVAAVMQKNTNIGPGVNVPPGDQPDSGLKRDDTNSPGQAVG